MDFLQRIPPERWIDDLRGYLTVLGGYQGENPEGFLLTRLALSPRDPILEEEYHARMWAAYSFLLKNIREFGDGKLGAFSKDTGAAWVRDELLYSLYLYYAAAPLETLDNDPSVELIRKVAMKAFDQ